MFSSLKTINVNKRTKTKKTLHTVLEIAQSIRLLVIKELSSKSALRNQINITVLFLISV